MAEFKKLTVTCPVCNKTKDLNIPIEVFQKKKLGMIKINVPQGSVCPEHHFLILADTKGKILGYEKLDMVLDSVTEKQEIQTEPLTLPVMEKSFGTKGFLHLIHATLYGFPILLRYNDPEFAKSIDGIILLLNTLISDSPLRRIPITFIHSSEADKKIRNEAEYLVITEKGDVLNVPWKENVKLEGEMVDQALELLNSQEQVFILKTALTNFITEALYAKELYEQIDRLSKDELVKKLNLKFKNVKFNKNRIKQLISFIERIYLHQKIMEK